MKVNWLVALVLLVLGCGGRVDQDEDAGDGDPPTSTPPDDDEPEPSPDEPTDAGTPLPNCEKGFDASAERDRPCNWVAKGYCYEEKLEACACACPRDPSVTSHCASGFPVEDGRVEVYCY
jgi:hypothetical protein